MLHLSLELKHSNALLNQIPNIHFLNVYHETLLLHLGKIQDVIYKVKHEIRRSLSHREILTKILGVIFD